MIDLVLQSAPCMARDWNPIAASSPESAVTAVLGGFVFSGIVVILSTREKSHFEAAQALKLLFVTFLGFAVTSYLLANDSGEQTCSRADSLLVVAGGPFGTFSVLMLVALTWLVAAYRAELHDVLRLLRVLIYTASAFVVLLLCISSQSFISAEVGNKGKFSLLVVSDVIYGAGLLAIVSGLAVLTRGRVVWLISRWRRWYPYLPRSSAYRAVSDAQLVRRVNGCFYAGVTYLAVVGFGAGVVIGLPQAWYQPIGQLLVYVLGFATLLAPVPVFVLGARALANINEQANRGHWANKSSPDVLAVADSLFELVRRTTVDGILEMRYGKYLIELMPPVESCARIRLYPKKNHLIASFEIPRLNDIDRRLETQGFGANTYSVRSGAYWLHLTIDDFEEHRKALHYLIWRVSGSVESMSP